MLYFYNKKTLSFTKLKYLYHYVILMILIFLGLLYFSYKLRYKIHSINNNSIKNELTFGSKEWKDSVFNDYELRAEIYLNKIGNTPIKSGMLKLAAYNAYDSTGVFLPIELALAQAQLESSMGTKGRSPINNPYNVGEYDSGTVLWFDNTFGGIQAYYFLMCKNYLKCKSLSTLLKDFTNCSGKRYATSQEYEHKLSKQITFIENFIDKELSKTKKSFKLFKNTQVAK